jgi:hypothetical protein
MVGTNPAGADSLRRARRRPNIAIRAVLVIVVLFSLWTRPVMDSDVRRFSALSVEAGTPYRDHAVDTDMGRVHHFCDPLPDGIPVGFRDQHPSPPAR